MTREEKLFRALSGVDGDLVDRARRPIRRSGGHWTAWCAGLAACLLLGFGIWRAALLWSSPAVKPDPPVDPSGPVTPIPPEDSVRPGADTAIDLEDAPRVEGGSAHFLRLTYALPDKAEETGTANFYISVDQEHYQLVQDAASTLIQPVTAAPEDLPPCDLRIDHFPGATLDQALADAQAWCADYATCEIDEEGVLHAGDGTDWDDAQADIRLVEDGQGGVYRLTARYFMEAAEGHGMRLNAMINTFTPLVEGDPTAALRPVVDRITAAVLADDLTAVSDLLAPEAQVTGFGEDRSGEAAVSAVDISLDQGGEAASVTVHLLLLEESACWLRLDLVLRDGKWLAAWGAIGIACG